MKAIKIKGGWIRKGDKCKITSATGENNKGKIIKVKYFDFAFPSEWHWIISVTGKYYHKSILEKYNPQ